MTIDIAAQGLLHLVSHPLPANALWRLLTVAIFVVAGRLYLTSTPPSTHETTGHLSHTPVPNSWNGIGGQILRFNETKKLTTEPVRAVNAIETLRLERRGKGREGRLWGGAAGLSSEGPQGEGRGSQERAREDPAGTEVRGYDAAKKGKIDLE
jgi:hypothetical protein